MINIQLYWQNNTIAFFSHPMGHQSNISASYIINFVAEFYRENVSFIPKTAK